MKILPIAVGFIVYFGILSFGHCQNPDSVHTLNFIIPILAAVVSGTFGAIVQNLFNKEKMFDLDKSYKQKISDLINKNKSQIEEIRQSMIRPIKIPQGDKRNSIILVGLGGTGKSTLIKNLLQNPEIKPEEKTQHYELYHGFRGSGKGDVSSSNIKNWFYISDYKGQNVGQLISSFIQQQKRMYSPMAWGFITSLILIVDLWPPKENKEDPDPDPQNKPDVQRIKQHINQWNDTALDAIFGLLTNEVRFVCLFINKIDLMSRRSDSSNSKYKEHYKELIQRLEKRCKNIKFMVCLGSAKYGESMNDLTYELIENSIIDN